MDSAAPQHPLPPAPLRQGPRPLPLHLLLAAMSWGSSALAWPSLSSASLASIPTPSPALQERLASLRQAAASLAPGALQSALPGELARRANRFLDGVEAYRRHPYRRDLTDPPAVWQDGTTRLLDYGALSAEALAGRPILCVPSLVNRAYILDLMQGQSLLRWLATPKDGSPALRPFLVDWDAPGPAERRFTLTDYVCGRLEAALDRVLALTGQKPLLLGYCMGGLLALALALRRQGDLGGLILMATPWDFHAGDEPGSARRQAESLARALPLQAPALDSLGELPVDMVQSLFTLLDPMTAVRKFQTFAAMPPDSAKARAFVALEDWLNDGTALAAPVAREAIGQWYGQNTPARGEWRIAGRVVDPAALRLPTLALVPQSDRIVPPGSAKALAAAIPGCELKVPPVGHIGMVVSGKAEREVWGKLVNKQEALAL